jgi:flagellar basal body-associated protein FliL
MDVNDEFNAGSEVLSLPDVERLLAQVAEAPAPCAQIRLVCQLPGSNSRRWLVAHFTLLGNHEDFPTAIAGDLARLEHLARPVFSSKTPRELEMPGSRHRIRAELISRFNGWLGANLVAGIRFDEFYLL